MVEALASQIRMRDFDASHGTRRLRERRDVTHVHMAYFLCYPSMIKRPANDESPGPWDQRY
jgi:hypothetical protein